MEANDNNNHSEGEPAITPTNSEEPAITSTNSEEPAITPPNSEEPDIIPTNTEETPRIQPHRYNTRRNSSHMLFVITPINATYCTLTINPDLDANDNAIRQELQQLMDMNCFTPLMEEDLNKKESQNIVIPSHMLVKQKYNPDGSYERTKARLVANGSYIDRRLFEDRGSPTLGEATSMALIASAFPI